MLVEVKVTTLLQNVIYSYCGLCTRVAKGTSMPFYPVCIEPGALCSKSGEGSFFLSGIFPGGCPGPKLRFDVIFAASILTHPMCVVAV